MENLKTVQEVVLNQKKEYIKKLFVEMDELRASI
jgi:sporulation protein YlmC with PRC-barrel domain